MKIIGVVGAGTMGAGIAHICALKGFEVHLWDMNDSLLNNAIDRMNGFMNKSIEKGKMLESEKVETLARIKTTTNLQELENVNIVIEAIVEDMEAKKEIFRRLDQILQPEAIIATNTSSMSITVLAESTQRQKQVAGLHFFNPAQIMRLVEVIRGFKTSDDTIAELTDFSKRLRKRAD